jgi:hypothetical protein
VFLVLLSVAGAVFPRIFAWPAALLVFWLGVASLVRAATPGERRRRR